VSVESNMLLDISDKLDKHIIKYRNGTLSLAIFEYEIQNVIVHIVVTYNYTEIGAKRIIIKYIQSILGNTYVNI
jgi:hypothetical protein